MAEIINTQLNALPAFLTSQDLVDLGLYATADCVYIARRRGNGPDFVRLGRKVLYPKSCIINFLQKRFKLGHIPCPSKTMVEEVLQC